MLKFFVLVTSSSIVLLFADINNFTTKLNNIMNGIQNHREPIDENKFDGVECPFILEVDEPAPQVEIDQKGNCKRFDIQFATRDQFMEIEGIDRRLARIIVGYRTSFGIKKIEDIKNISGMNDKVYRSIINHIQESEECFRRLDEEIVLEKSEKLNKANNTAKQIDPVLEMIFDDQAKLSGRWYRVGDEVDNSKIIKIEFDSIKLKTKKGDVREIKISQTGNIQIEFLEQPKNK